MHNTLPHMSHQQTTEKKKYKKSKALDRKMYCYPDEETHDKVEKYISLNDNETCSGLLVKALSFYIKSHPKKFQ